MSSLYERLRAESKSAGEKNDCAVIAVCVVARRPYPEVLEVFSRFGRKPRRRTDERVTNAVLLQYGLQRITVFSRFRPMALSKPLWVGKTVTTTARNVPKRGRYLIRIRGHIIGVRAGEVHDWTAARRHHVLRVDRVAPLRGGK